MLSRHGRTTPHASMAILRSCVRLLQLQSSSALPQSRFWPSEFKSLNRNRQENTFVRWDRRAARLPPADESQTIECTDDHYPLHYQKNVKQFAKLYESSYSLANYIPNRMRILAFSLAFSQIVCHTKKCLPFCMGSHKLFGKQLFRLANR